MPNLENAALIHSAMTKSPPPATTGNPNSLPLAEGPSRQEIGELLARYNAGDFESAEKLAKALTEKFPRHAIGWKALGAILQQSGRAEEALYAKRKSVEISPSDPEAHHNLGNTLHGLGRLTEAEASYLEALRLRPAYAEVHSTLANTLRDQRRLADAERSCHEALRLKPDHAEAHNNLGNILKDQGRLKEAEASYREAIRLKPGYAKAYSNLGLTLQDLGRFTDSEACHREALRLNPGYAEAHSNLGIALQGLGHLTEAEACHREALRLRPGYAEAHSNLGNTLKQHGRLKEAEASYREALRLKPDYAEAHSNLGNVLKDLGRLTEAQASYREALRFKPDLAAIHSNLGVVLQDLGRLNEAEVSYREALRLQPDLTDAHSNLLFALNYVESLPVDQALDEARRYGSAVSSRAQPKFTAWTELAPQGKLRIGFVSGDFRNHPVGYFIEGLLAHMNRKQFELLAFPTTPQTDALTDRIKPLFTEWVPLYGKSDRDAAHAIHQRGIHVLLDLSGHTAHNRLPVFAYKPAPVQVSWLGYFATTGLPEMDFFIGDPVMAPESERGHFSEEVWRLPDTWLCLARPTEDIPTAPLPALQNGYVTFGCFGNLSKMGSEVVRLWSMILESVPSSRLFLKSNQLADAGNIARVKQAFAACGVDDDRLILEGPSSRANYFAAYRRLDIVLDTFPYPGGTTSVDALWMGVPVLTLKGDRFLSHLGESIAHNAGHADWIAQDREDYVRKAVSMASDLVHLAAVRSGLRDKVLQSPLFNAKKFAADFGEATKGMFESRRGFSGARHDGAKQGKEK